MIADIAVVTQQQTRGVGGFSAHFTNNTFQTAPALTQHRLGDLHKRVPSSTEEKHSAQNETGDDNDLTLLFTQ